MTRPRVCNWMRFVCATGIIVVVLPIWTRAQTLASQASDVQQLKDKLLQLEQEMNALKGQINAIEQAPQSSNLTIPTAASSGAPAPEKPPKPQKEDEPKSNIDLYGFIMSPDLIDSAVANGAKGIVIAGVGNGNMNQASLEAAARAAKKGVIVVRSSRVPTGTVGRNVEVNDDEMNLVASDELNPQKSRILLMLALLKSRPTADIQNLFYTY